LARTVVAPRRAAVKAARMVLPVNECRLVKRGRGRRTSESQRGQRKRMNRKRGGAKEDGHKGLVVPFRSKAVWVLPIAGRPGS
jgi:hypothetical protein